MEVAEACCKKHVRIKRNIVVICTVCGNEAGDGTCRFCGSKQEPDSRREPDVFHKSINLELGRPFVENAIKKLLGEIQAARIERVSILTVIHGYGSSGIGGAIRHECRKILDYLCGTGMIKGYIPGEKFSSKSGSVKALLQQFPQLTRNRNLNRQNPGVTLVVLK
jgi:hypothetical protein